MLYRDEEQRENKLSTVFSARFLPFIVVFEQLTTSNISTESISPSCLYYVYCCMENDDRKGNTYYYTDHSNKSDM